MTDARPCDASRTLLIVDDEDLLVELLRRILTRQGYRVIEARSGREALDIYDARADEIDLVITDLVMPEMDGSELAEKLLGHEPAPRVLISTGFSAHADIAALLESGVRGVVMKPYQTEQLVGIVREALAA